MGQVFFGNLSFDTTESDLNTLISPYGRINALKLVIDQYTHRSKGFALVEMALLEEAKKVVAALNETTFMGRVLIVSLAKEKE